MLRFEQLGAPSACEYDCSLSHSQSQLCVPVSLVKAFLSDTEDVQYPVYRWHDATGECTLSSVLVDFASNQVAVYNSRPSLTAPLYTFNLTTTTRL
jgi:hypothetical protein